MLTFEEELLCKNFLKMSQMAAAAAYACYYWDSQRRCSSRPLRPHLPTERREETEILHINQNNLCCLPCSPDRVAGMPTQRGKYFGAGSRSLQQIIIIHPSSTSVDPYHVLCRPHHRCTRTPTSSSSSTVLLLSPTLSLKLVGRTCLAESDVAGGKHAMEKYIC